MRQSRGRRMARPVLLMLLSRHPYAQKSGRASMLRQRIEQAQLKFETRIVVLGEPAGDASDEGLSFVPMAPPLAIAANAFRLNGLPLQSWLYFSDAARTRIGELAAGCAGIYVDMLRLAPLLEGIAEKAALIVDFDDLLSARYSRASSDGYDVLGFLAHKFGPLSHIARAFAAPVLSLEATRMGRYEQDMLTRADLVLFTSPREASSVARYGVYVMGAPPLVAAYDAPPAGSRLIFLGNMRYGENVVMLRALAEAAEALGAEFPNDAIIEVVGDHAPDLPAQFDAKRFKFLGRAADLGVLAGAGIFLAPVMSGSGVKLKVLDGMALGCPVVGTPIACEGLSVRPNREIIVAADAKGVLSTALALRERSTLKAMLTRRARAYVQRVHAPAIGARVAEAMAAAVTRAKAR